MPKLGIFTFTWRIRLYDTTTSCLSSLTTIHLFPKLTSHVTQMLDILCRLRDTIEQGVMSRGRWDGHFVTSCGRMARLINGFSAMSPLHHHPNYRSAMSPLHHHPNYRSIGTHRIVPKMMAGFTPISTTDSSALSL